MNRRVWIRGVCFLLCGMLLAGSAHAAYETIRPGARGDHVVAMQRALDSLGYPLVPDGRYGPMSVEAVRLFQQSQKLTADGLAGDRTLTALYALAPAFAPQGAQPAGPTQGSAVPEQQPPQQQPQRYELGSFGVGVSDMQIRLNSLSYDCGRIDGVFDTQTRLAVIAFQRNNRLTADGIAGAMTLARLNAPDAVANTGSTVATPATDAPAATQAPIQTPAPIQSSAPISLRLEMGSTGAEVVRLQNRLKQLGFLQGSADGKFGRLTRLAVIAYQRSQSLGADGIAGAKTLARLYAGEGSLVQPTPLATAAPATQAPASTQVPPASRWAVVNTSNGGVLNFRSSPETRSNNLIGSLAVGTRVEILSDTGTWSTIRANNREGYVMSRFLAPAADEPVATPVATAEPTQAPTDAPATLEPTAQPTEAPAFPSILRSGDTGEDVTKLQQDLKSLAYEVAVNGVFDAATLAAVQRFQSLNALTADGIFGSQSAQVLLSGSARRGDEQPLTYSTLRIDNRDGTGGAIRAMQERLKELGYRVSINGTFDILTHEAVVGFQRRNSLTVSGVADPLMQARLFAASAKDASVPVDEPGADEGKIGGPSSGSVRLLHWFNDIKPSISSRQNIVVYDPGSGISFSIRFYSLGNHADSEPATLRDTLLMNRAFGMPSWDIHTVYVKLPSGVWTLAAMHNRPHLTRAVNNNGFGGHLCIHFLRDLDETQRNDPNYGMANQRAIRSAWKSLTGEVIE